MKVRMGQNGLFPIFQPQSKTPKKLVTGFTVLTNGIFSIYLHPWYETGAVLGYMERFSIIFGPDPRFKSELITNRNDKIEARLESRIKYVRCTYDELKLTTEDSIETNFIDKL